MRLFEKYRRYKKSYFRLFTATCDAIDTMERLLAKIPEEDEKAKLLAAQVKDLKTAQQLTEEIIIAD